MTSDCRIGRVKYDISRFEISINLNGNSYDLWQIEERN